MRESVAWLRWSLPLACLWIAASAPTAPMDLVTSSGTHVWWSVRDAERWAVMHAVGGTTGSPVYHVAARFSDQPVRLAADGGRIWAIFRGASGRLDVVTARAERNPASDLWFLSPAGMRLCASLPAREVESAAGFEGELWCLTTADAGSASRLVGEDWRSVPLPAIDVVAKRRALVAVRGALWLLALLPDGSTMRWCREAGAWRPLPLDVPAWRRPIDGSTMLSFETEEGAIGSVEAGRFVSMATVPEGSVPIGWGDGFASLDSRQSEARWSTLDFRSGRFVEARPLVPQASSAPRWFHLPLLGVASLGALMLAVMLRAVRGVPGVPSVATWVPLPFLRRLAALALDAAPVGAAALLAFDADLDALLCAPLWATDLQDAMPFVWMTVGTAAFGTLEECAGARSMGKRVLGGKVVRQDGSVVSAGRHVVRNLLKGLTMLAPILALPTIASRRGIGVAEVVSDTAVIQP